MNKPPRAHHYVPEFFLAGFTPSGRKDDFLHVVDHGQTKHWRAKPKEVAHERDFYRIDIPGLKPETVEEDFAKIEGLAANVIKKIIEANTLPHGEDFLTLMTFVALSSARVPRVRKVFSDPLIKMVERMGEMMTATREHWEQAIENAKLDGVELKGDLSYEKMKEFIDGKQYTIEPDQSFHIKTLLDTVKTIYPLLLKRNWRLLIAKDGTGEFICSDDPVGLVWTTKDVPALFGPGFGMPDTEVTIALSKQLALVGRFEGKSGVFRARREDIAAINSRTAIGARCLYSAQEDFLWIDTQGKARVGKILDEILNRSRT